MDPETVRQRREAWLASALSESTGENIPIQNHMPDINVAPEAPEAPEAEVGPPAMAPAVEGVDGQATPQAPDVARNLAVAPALAVTDALAPNLLTLLEGIVGVVQRLSASGPTIAPNLASSSAVGAPPSQEMPAPVMSASSTWSGPSTSTTNWAPTYPQGPPTAASTSLVGPLANGAHLSNAATTFSPSAPSTSWSGSVSHSASVRPHCTSQGESSAGAWNAAAHCAPQGWGYSCCSAPLPQAQHCVQYPKASPCCSTATSTAPAGEAAFTLLNQKRANSSAPLNTPAKRGRGRPKKLKEEENAEDDSAAIQCTICKIFAKGKCSVTRCGHIFHSECLEKWCQTPGQKDRYFKVCPNCGQDYDPEEANPLFL